MKIILAVLISLIAFPVAAQECIKAGQIISKTAMNASQNGVIVVINDKNEIRGANMYIKDTFFFADDELKDVNEYVMVPDKKYLSLFALKQEQCLDFILPMNYKDVEGIVDTILSYKDSKDL